MQTRFLLTASVVDAVHGAPAEDRDPVPQSFPVHTYERVLRLPQCKMAWIVRDTYEVVIPICNVLFMEGNMWDFPHVRALRRHAQRDRCLYPPAGRVYQVDEEHVVMSQRYAAAGELEYQMGLSRPWEEHEIGQLYAQLLDGNHRALAALLEGDSHVVVYCGENYREDLPDEVWIREPRVA